MEPLKLGLIGCGDIANRAYLPAIKEESSRLRLVATCDLQRQRAERAAAEYGPATVYADAAEMLAKADLDGVMVLTSMVPHGPLCIAGLEAGKHVYVEKPMAVTVAEADRMVELSESKGLILSCAPSTILLSAFQRVKEVIASGEVGKITFAHAIGAHHGPARWDGYTSDPTWFYQKGAGPLFDLAVYPVQILIHLLGAVKRVSAYSALALPEVTMTPSEVRGQPVHVGIDDTTCMLLDFGGIPMASVDTSYNVLSARCPDMQFYGSEGAITAPQFLSNEVGIWRQSDRQWQIANTPATLYDQLGVAAGLPHWLDCIRDGHQPVNNARHGRHLLEVLLACYDSAKSGKAVEIKSRP
jgi:predicted dehydrogenase